MRRNRRHRGHYARRHASSCSYVILAKALAWDERDRV